MPIFDDDSMEQSAIAGTGYGYSGKRIEELGASEYTLVVIATDVSGSVAGFDGELEKAVKEVVKTCRKSPRADNLMLRFMTFDTNLAEVHGFRPLGECDLAKYDGCIQIGGSTALYDATVNAVRSAVLYGAELSRNDYGVNAVLFVITDGCDNASKMTPADIKKALGEAVRGEALESVLTILIGVNVNDATVSKYLGDFKQQVGFDQYVELARADARTLAWLARFVSQSIRAQSQALGTGGPSKALNPSTFVN